MTNQAVEEYQTKNGPADYALFISGILLGVLGANKEGIDLQSVLEQAIRRIMTAEGSAGQVTKL